jgi:N-dimethylarginine dimethylaminohydrolase
LNKLGFQSESGDLISLVVKHARAAFINDDVIKAQWEELGYFSRPDFERSNEEYDNFLSLLAGFGIEIHFLPRDDSLTLDSLYPRDAAISCNNGMILCNMGKESRQDEPVALGRLFQSIGIPIYGQITGDGRLEGGDVVWIDERTVAVGRGYRTNEEGIRQLKELLGDFVDEVIAVHLPHWRGVDDVFHLMSIYSPLDRDLGLVYSPLMPVAFREELLSRGIELIEVPDTEFETMGGNVLAVAPRRCIMLSGNPLTRSSLERKGVEVFEFQGVEICHKGAGGPTCLTRPILREVISYP